MVIHLRFYSPWSGFRTTTPTHKVMAQGKQLTYEEKLAVVTVKHYFDAEKARGKSVSTLNPTRRVSQALQFSLSTVKGVLAEVGKNQGVVAQNPILPRGCRERIVKDREITNIRHLIQDAALRGEMATVPKLLDWLQEDGIEVTYSALRRALHRAGFRFGKSARRSALKERADVIANRRRYLARLRENRTRQGKTKRPEVYLDETYVNVNHRKHLTWHEPGGLVNVPSGVGERIIIVDAIIQDDRAKRWERVSGAHLNFKAKLRTGDYHEAMDAGNFSKWLKQELLPNIPHKSLLILDNASYHNVLSSDTFPQPHHKKAELQQWLVDHQVSHDAWLLKPALYQLCKQHAPRPSYAIDELALEYDCEVLRTPQYHPELQPIEHVWGIAKSHLANSQKGDYTLSSLKDRLAPAFATITMTVCKKTFRHVRQEEDRYWKIDEQLDALNESDEG